MSALTRLREAWSALLCKGGPVFVEEGSFADRTLATGGADIRTTDGQKLLWLECAQTHKRCNSCPRGQAYRQLLSMHKKWTSDLHVQFPVDAIEAYVGDREREIAEVHDSNAKTLFARRDDGMGHGNLEPYPVLDPVAPGVVQAEHRAQDGKSGGDDLHYGGFHDRNVASARGVA